MEGSGLKSEIKTEIHTEIPLHTANFPCDPTVADDILTADAAHLCTSVSGNNTHNSNEVQDFETESAASVNESENSEDNLSEELQQGIRILKELMSDSNKTVNWPFLWPVDAEMSDTADYYERIQKPMWLYKMKEKFEKGEYKTITQFVADFRLMLENCYRYNGPDHFVSKRAQKLETMMEQKLTLLSRNLREKTSIKATSGETEDETGGIASLGSRRRTRAIVPHDSTALLNQLREQEVQREREMRKQQVVHRKKQQEEYHQQMLDWEERIMEGNGQEMKAMWELPQIGHFLFLCQIPLAIGEVSQFELERCFYMPRESSALQMVMTALLSTPFQRTKSGKQILMPYHVWEEKLRVKSRLWYKLYHDSNYHTAKVAEKMGLDPMFFSVLGKRNPLEKKKFHQISVYKRVWLVKSLCDYCLETQECLQNALDNQAEEELREYRLGVDAQGNTYLHFPQFCGADLRVYRQAYIPEPKVEKIRSRSPTPQSKARSRSRTPQRKSSVTTEDEEFETSLTTKKKKCSSTRNNKLKEDSTFIPFSRPSHLRQNVKTVLPVPVYEESDSSSSSSEEDKDDAVSQSDSTLVDSSANDNTHDKHTRLSNKRINQLIESDNGSESSSLDNEYFEGRRLRSNKLFKFEDESSLDSEKLSRSRRLTTRKTRSSARKIPNCHSDKGSDVEESGNMCIKSDGTKQGDKVKEGRSQLSSISSEHGTDVSNLQFDGENSCDTDNTKVTPKKGNDGYSSEDTLEGGDLQDEKTGEEYEREEDLKNRPKEESCDLKQQNSDSNLCSVQDKSDFDSKGYNDFVMDEKGDNGISVCPLCNKLRSQSVSSLSEKGLFYCDIHKQEINVKNNPDNSIDMETDHDDSNKCANSRKEMDVLSLSNSENKFKEHSLISGIHDIIFNDDSDMNTPSNIFSDINLENENETVSQISEFISNEESMNTKTEEDINNKNDLCTLMSSTLRDTCNKISSGINSLTSKSIVESSDKRNIPNETELKIIPEHDNKLALKCESANSIEDHSQDKLAVVSMVTKDTKENFVKDDGKNVTELGMKTEGSDICEKLQSDVNTEMSVNFKANGSAFENTCFKENFEEKVQTTCIKTDCENDAESKEVIEDVKKDLKEDGKKGVKEDGIGDVKEEESDGEEEGLIMGPEIGPFELIVDSVEELRKLVDQFAPPDPEASPIKSKRQKLMKPPPRKRCVVALHERLLYLLKELEPWEYKLCQAAKRARIKMKKEQESWKEVEEALWESEKSEKTDSETEEADTDIDDKEGEVNQSNRGEVKPSLSCQEDVSMDAFLNEDGCLDVSSRGRIRKRRIIPNNVEDTAKKRKTLSSTPTTASSTEAELLNKPIVTSTKAGQLLTTGNETSQILLHSSDGKKTLVTGLTPQQLFSLRFLKPGTAILHPNTIRAPQTITNARVSQPATAAQVIQPTTLQVRTPGMRLPRILTSKQASHPVMQQLLSTVRQPGSVVKSGTITTQPSSNVAMPTALSSLSPTVIKSGVQGKTTQYYAANVNSLPPAVLQQLLKSNAAKLLPGATPSSAMVLLSAVTPETTNSVAGQTVMLNLTGNQAPVMSSALQTPNKAVIISNQTSAELRRLVVPQATVATIMQGEMSVVASVTRPPTVVYPSQLKPSRVVGQKIVLSPSSGAAKILSPVQISASVANSAGQKIILSPANAALGAVDIQKLVLQQPQIKSPQNIHAVKVVTPNVVGDTKTDVLMKSIENTTTTTTARTLFVSTTDESEKNLKIVSDLANSSSGCVKTSSQPMIQISPNKLIVSNPVNSQKYASNITVKTLLEIRKESDKGAVISNGANADCQTIPVTSSCLVLNSDANVNHFQTTIHGNTQIPATNKSTLIIQSTSGGIKTLKIPSKEALDSAVKAVVTEVKTSLPTAHIKVPSSTTMPLIQPRKNVTKTIQSMKLPIPTAPAVQSKYQKPIHVSGANIVSTVPMIGQTNSSISNLNQIIQVASASNQMIAKPAADGAQAVVRTSTLTADNVNQKNMMLKVYPNSQVPGQGVIQGYLTPQGIIIPQGNIQQQKTAPKQVMVSPQILSSQGLVLQTSQIVQNTSVSSLSANSLTKFPTTNTAKGITQISNLPVNFVHSSPQNTAAISSLKCSSIKSSTDCSTKVDVVSQTSKCSSVIAMQLNNVGNVNLPQTALVKSTSQVTATPSVHVHQPNVKQQTSIQSHLNLQQCLIPNQPIRGNSGILQAVPQSPVQLTSPVVSQIQSNTALVGQLKSPAVGQQIMGYVGNTHIIPQSSLNLVNMPQGLAQIIHQPRTPTNLNNLTHIVNPQNRTTMKEPTNTGQQIQLPNAGQSGVILGNALGSVQQQGQLGQLKSGHAMIGHGSSSELMKQFAAVQQLNSGQQGGNPVAASIGTLQTGNLTNPVLLQLPGNQGQGYLKVQGQTLHGQTMLLLSPKQGSSKGLITSDKDKSIQSKTVSSNVSSSFDQTRKVADPVAFHKPRMQLSFSTSQKQAPLSKAHSSVSPKMATGKIQVHPKKIQETDITKHSQEVNQQMKVFSTDKSSLTSETSFKTTEQTKPRPNSPGSGSQKLFLYNIGGQLVTPQGVPVTVENGVLKVIPKGQCTIPQETLDMMQKSAQLQGLTSTKDSDNVDVKIKFDVAEKSQSMTHTTVETTTYSVQTTAVTLSSAGYIMPDVQQASNQARISHPTPSMLQSPSTVVKLPSTNIAKSFQTLSTAKVISCQSLSTAVTGSVHQSTSSLTSSLQNSIPAIASSVSPLNPAATAASSITLHFQNPSDFRTGSQLVQQLPKKGVNQGVGPGYFVVRSQRPGLYSYIDSSGHVVTTPVDMMHTDAKSTSTVTNTTISTGNPVPIRMFANMAYKDPVVIKEEEEMTDVKKRIEDVSQLNHINGNITEETSITSVGISQHIPKKDKCESEKEAALNLLSLANQSFEG